ncbi:MAG: hypothetical protein ACRCU3_02415 [Eubacteriaceae bacterium]
MEGIRNPEKQKIVLSLLGSILGLMLIFVPNVITFVAAYHFYFVYFGIVIILFGLGFALFYYKRLKDFNRFLEQKDQFLIWEYEEEHYTNFIGELNQIQKNVSKKKVWTLLGIELVITVLLFVMLEPGYKWLSVVFLIFFGTVSLIFTLVMPQSFKYRAMIKPYVSIISVDSAYIMGRFHKWSKAKAKIKDHDNGAHVHKVLAINYEAMTRNGKLFQEWTALIPNPTNKDEMLEAKAWVNKINKRSREYEEEKRNRKSYLERLFYRMLGRNEDGTIKVKKSDKEK